ncbi:MAG: cytidine/deoxycytidylate deaminase family protein [Elusimicrobiota bacterium]
MRPSWDEYFMSIAKEVAKRSTCTRRNVGAVLVKDKRILATGYNGTVRDLDHCDAVGCIREKKKIESGTRHELCRGLHAEQNALLFASSYGLDTKHSVLYSTIQPCIMCAKMIVQSGIKKVVYIGDYPDVFALDIFKEANVELVKFK